MFIVICNIVLLLDTYEEAMKHLNKAVEASELSSTDVEKTGKRRRVKKQIFDNSQPLPKQKAIEKRQRRSLLFIHLRRVPKMSWITMNNRLDFPTGSRMVGQNCHAKRK